MIATSPLGGSKKACSTFVLRCERVDSLMKKRMSLVLCGILVLSSILMFVSPGAGVITDDDMPHTHTNPTTADYAWKYDATALGCGGANPDLRCKSYIEWWFFKVSEIPGMNANPNAKETFNMMGTIIVVNPW